MKAGAEAGAEADTSNKQTGQETGQTSLNSVVGLWPRCPGAQVWFRLITRLSLGGGGGGGRSGPSSPGDENDKFKGGGGWMLQQYVIKGHYSIYVYVKGIKLFYVLCPLMIAREGKRREREKKKKEKK